MGQMRLWHRWRGAFDVITANSAATKQCLLEAGVEATEVIWPGVPVQPLGRPLAPEPTVAFAGRLVREKGVDVLIRAFSEVVRHVPTARLVLAGDGPERGSLLEQVRDLGLTGWVKMVGHLPHEETQSLFAGAWVQAVPSRWSEPFGMVAAEAMMRGTAVVATAAGGLREIVRDGRTGFLVPPGDAQALVGALLRLLQAREVADTMGREGREIAVATLGVEAHVDRFVALYRNLGGGHEPRGCR
jgi:glycosyltransferase involved in cell wall biosynthesis